MKIKLGVVLLLTVMLGFSGLLIGTEPLKVALLLNGNLGDLSFFDSAAAGIKRAEEELGITARIVEMGNDVSAHKSVLADFADLDYDIIIVGTWQMAPHIEEIAPQYPEKRFFIFDSSVNYSLGNLGNVYAITYKQNEGSFLAGALAAMVTNSDMPYANEEKMIGFLGGMDSPVINDFLVGYIEGALYEDPEIKVAISYIGDFFDAAKGKEMALAQYNRGVDIGFNVASQAGLGQLDAAKQVEKYAIGVDSDQAMLFAETDPAKSELTLTSMMKRVDNSLFRALSLHLEGKLEYGTAEDLGLKEGAVGLAENEFFLKNVPEEFIEKLQAIEEMIISGEIVVKSGLMMDSNELQELRDSVRP